MLNSIRNSRAVFATVFTLLLLGAGLYASSTVYAQSGLTIVVDHVDSNGWRAHIEGTCPPGYDLKTRNLEGSWNGNQNGVTVRAHCVRQSDGFECWHVTKWIRNPGYVAPTKTPAAEGAPTATPRPPQPTATPCPQCLVPTPTGQVATTPVPPTATAVATAVAPPATPESPQPGDTDAQPVILPPSSPCPSNPDGMPTRWVYRNGREEPICEETSSAPAPVPAASSTGYAVVRDGAVVAHFDVTVTQGEVARAEYVFSDGTTQVIVDAPFSPDEERPPLPNPLEVVVPPGQSVTLNLTVVGYDDVITMSSNAVSSADVEIPAAIQSQQVQQAETMPRAATTNAQTAPMPRSLPNTGGEIDEREAFWLMHGPLAALAAGFLIILGVGMRFAFARRSE